MNKLGGRRRLLVLTIALAALSSSPVPARAAGGNVDEVGTSFAPAEVRIGVNERVTWTNRSSQSHTVTFTGEPGDLHPKCDPSALGLLRTGCQAPGSTVGWTFTKPGTYAYYCKIHANAPSPMRGVVVVGTATTTPSTSSSSPSSKSSSTTATTQKATSSTTTTTRPLATSSTLIKSTTTSTTEATSVLLPGEPPPLSGDDASSAASRSGGSGEGGDSGTVALIVGLLLAVSAGGGYLLWRLRPGRA